MQLRVHISKLFIGDDDLHVRGPLLASRHSDGYFLILRGHEQFLSALNAIQTGNASAQEWFEVEVSGQMIDYKGHRHPTSFSVDTDSLWFDYDTFRHVWRLHSIRRKKYETQYELNQRLRTDSKIIHESKERFAFHHLMTSLDGSDPVTLVLNDLSTIRS